MSEPGARLSPGLFAGLAIASIGGPLALGALYLPGAADEVTSSSGLVTLLAIAAFCPAVWVWRSYSARIASAGGLAAFTEAAAGRRLALAQAAIWSVSYALYLPFTVAFCVYDLLPTVIPGIGAGRPVLEIALPLAISALVLARGRAVYLCLAGLAALQLGLLLVLGAIELAHSAGPLHSFAPHGGGGDIARGGAGISLLFVCASLPLFAGGAVRGGTRTIRPVVAGAFALVAAYVLFAGFPLAGLPDPIRSAPIPGMAVADAYAGHGLGTVVGLATIASVVALIVVEFLALGWLVAHMGGVPPRRVLAAIAVAFVASDAVSLIDPEGFYTSLLRPSLIALYVSQIVVFAVYPVYRRAVGGLRARDLLAAGAAASLMGYGLYLATTGPLAT